MRYTKTTPRRWTQDEIHVLQEGIQIGKSIATLAHELKRSEISVSIKKKRLDKTGRTYNDKHRVEKYAANESFLSELKPKSVLDLYAGPVSFYKGKVHLVVSNDLEYSGHDFNTRANLCLAHLYSERKRFDVVDLDPFGSAFECFEMAVQTARRGLIVTFGELGHKRWKRTDFTSRTYRIDRVEDLTLEKMCDYIVEVAARYKKVARLHASYDWKNIGRAYFVLSDMPKQPSRIKQNSQVND